APPLKALPAPAITTARIRASSRAWSRPAAITLRTAWPRPLTGAWSSVITQTPSCASYRVPMMLSSSRRAQERGPHAFATLRPSHFEPFAPDRLARAQGRGRAVEHDTPMAHHVHAMRDRERDGQLLL